MQYENTNEVHTVNAKEFLSRIYDLEKKINAKTEQAQMYRDLAQDTSAHLSGMPHSASPAKSPMAEALNKAADLERSAEQDKQELEIIKIKALNAIGQLGETAYQLLLIDRYFKHMKWPEIGGELNRTKCTALRLHNKALDEIEKILNS